MIHKYVYYNQSSQGNKFTYDSLIQRKRVTFGNLKKDTLIKIVISDKS